MPKNCMKCRREIPNDSLYCAYCGSKQVKKIRNVKSRGNGQGTVYKLPNGKYKAEVVLGYYKEEGKLKKWRRTRTFEKKKDAVACIPLLKELPAKEKSMSLHELYDIFTSTRKYDKLGKSQKNKLRYAWNRMKKIHSVDIQNLTIERMQDIIDSETSTFYPARDMKVLFSHLYTIAIQRGKAEVNRSQYLELPDAPNAKRQVFTEEEVAKFWDDYNGQTPEGSAEPHEFTGYILIMIYTGMRIGELFRILKDNIHLEKRYMIGGEKTAAGIDREIPISKSIISVITHFYNKHQNKLVEKNLWNFYEEYWETIRRLKINEYPPQTCRHTYFTMMVQNEVHPAIIASVGGHAQYETAINHYNRLPLKDKIDAVDKL